MDPDFVACVQMQDETIFWVKLQTGGLANGVWLEEHKVICAISRLFVCGLVPGPLHEVQCATESLLFAFVFELAKSALIAWLVYYLEHSETTSVAGSHAEQGTLKMIMGAAVRLRLLALRVRTTSTVSS